MNDPILCIVEIPQGSRNKYELDLELGAIKLDRFLCSSVVYLTDYGYVPGLRERSSAFSGCATTKGRTTSSCACRGATRTGAT